MLKQLVTGELRQQQTISPQVYQSLKILQMNCLQLDDYIKNELLENPVLELDETYSLADSLQFGMYSSSQTWENNSGPDRDEQPQPEIRAPDDGNNLREHLINQFDSAITKQEARLLHVLLDHLDDNGYLVLDETETCANYGFSKELLGYGISYLQTLDPFGVCARNLAECLCIQLNMLGYKDPLLRRIAMDYLEDIAASKYKKIAGELGRTLSETHELCGIIKSLNPKPGSYFGDISVTPIIPDVFVTVEDSEVSVSVVDRAGDGLHISSYYARLAKQDEYGEATAYLEKKLANARWLIKAVEKRKHTIKSVAEHIVNYQREFFLNKNGTLKPLTIKQASLQLGLHESTVSRAVSEKYLQCMKGTYPLKRFFAGVSAKSDTAAAASRDSIEARIREIISNEDKKTPLSDNRIMEILTSEGIQLSRRVIAKYRAEMNIPVAGARKEI